MMLVLFVKGGSFSREVPWQPWSFCMAIGLAIGLGNAFRGGRGCQTRSAAAPGSIWPSAAAVARRPKRSVRLSSSAVPVLPRATSEYSPPGPQSSALRVSRYRISSVGVCFTMMALAVCTDAGLGRFIDALVMRVGHFDRALSPACKTAPVGSSARIRLGRSGWRCRSCQALVGGSGKLAACRRVIRKSSSSSDSGDSSKWAFEACQRIA